ncbi:MAG TPA: hypothetical protein VEY49_01740, partial [Solirubrobacteraceae bacterium]|nr:hypothetical protein [Solirubrobacteraceae bacterium]
MSTAPPPATGHGLALYGAARAELLLRCERAVLRARREGAGVLAGLTLRLRPEVDPSAVVFASRAAGDDWFCFEQPDREGAALATLGCVARLAPGASAAVRGGDGRFAAAAGAWRELAGRAVGDVPDGPAGAGLVAVGGFAFAPAGGAAP